jgi:hypothetical protein
MCRHTTRTNHILGVKAGSMAVHEYIFINVPHTHTHTHTCMHVQVYDPDKPYFGSEGWVNGYT